MNRTIVCVIAETRSNKITWPSFKNFVLDVTGADLLLCISTPFDYDFGNPFWKFAKYRFTAPEFFDWGIAFDQVQKSECNALANVNLPNWRMLLDIGDQWLGGVKGVNQQPGSGSILIFFRWLLLDYIRREGLLERYDRFIITRSDFVWEAPHPPILNLNPKNIWIPDGEGYGGVTDRHAVLSRTNIEPYLDLIGPIIKEPQILFSEMCNKNNWNLEQFIEFSLKRNKIKVKIRFFPYVMYSVRESGGSTRWSKGLWSKKLGYYIKYPTEYQSAISSGRIIKTTNDWGQILLHGSEIGFNTRVENEGGDVIKLEHDWVLRKILSFLQEIKILGYLRRLRIFGLMMSIISPNIKNIRVSMRSTFLNSECLVLSIDYSGKSGFLHLSKNTNANSEKIFLDKVELIEKSQNKFNIVSMKDGKYYNINDDGRLVKSKTKKYNFLLRSKYAVKN